MLKESEVGKRRLKQPCGRTEFQTRRKSREGTGENMSTRLMTVMQYFTDRGGIKRVKIDSRMFCCLRIFETAKFEGDITCVLLIGARRFAALFWG